MLPLDPGQGLVPLKDGPQDGDSLPSVIAAGELQGRGGAHQGRRSCRGRGRWGHRRDGAAGGVGRGSGVARGSQGLCNARGEVLEESHGEHSLLAPSKGWANLSLGWWSVSLTPLSLEGLQHSISSFAVWGEATLLDQL